MAQVFYSVVIREPDVVLAENEKVSGNFPQITRKILGRLPRQGRFSYAYNSAYCFHYMSSGELVVLCLADEAFPRRIAFLYLEDIYSRFLERYSTLLPKLISFGAKDFSETLLARMDYFNSDSKGDKLEALKTNLGQLRTVMIDNIDKVLARGEKVEMLVKKTEVMSENAVVMRKRSTQLRKKMWWRNVKTYLLCCFTLLAVLLVTTLYICGLTFQQCS